MHDHWPSNWVFKFDIVAKQFNAIARLECARVFLPAASVMARHTVSGEAVALQVPPRLIQIAATKQADAWGTPEWKR